jgi:hypothetical protein
MKFLKRHFRIILSIILLLFLTIMSTPYLISYQPNTLAIQSFQQASKTSFGYEFNPQAKTHIIVVPGGLVSHVAYAPLAYGLSLKGFRVSVVEVPLNLAITYPDMVFQVDTSASEHVFLLGHSLGGVSASLSMQKKAFSGLITLASYPLQPDKIIGNPKYLSIIASKDGLLNLEAYQKAINEVNHTEVVIEGGNHAQFGSYGKQTNDLEATITNAQQLDLTINAISQWILDIIQP